MKKIFSFLVALMLTSCQHLVEYKEYWYIVQNDTDDDIFYIVDYTPSDQDYMLDSTIGWAERCGGQHHNIFDPWVKKIQDSVCVYVGYAESLRVNGKIEYEQELVKDEYLVSKMVIKRDLFLDIINTWPKILYYPPDPSADIQLYYY